MYKVLVLGREGTELGFRLAGADARTFRRPGEIAAIVEEERERGGYAIVLVPEDAFEELPDQEKRSLEELSLPIVFPLPMDARPGEREESRRRLAATVRRALGFSFAIPVE